MDRNTRFPNYHSVVNRNNIVVSLNDRTDQQNQTNSPRGFHIPPLLPPPRPPQIPPVLLGHRNRHPSSTAQQNENKDGGDADSERGSVTVEETPAQLGGPQTPISFKDAGALFAQCLNYGKILAKELAEEKVISESLRNEKSVTQELFKTAQAEILSQKNKIEEIRKVNEQQKIWETKYKKLNETYTSAQNELRDKNNKIANFEQVINLTKSQLEHCKNKFRKLEVSEINLRQELKGKIKEYNTLESNYSAKCAELKCKSDDVTNLESKFNTKCDELKQKEDDIIKLEKDYKKKLKNVKADLMEKKKINLELKELNENLKREKVNLDSRISKKDQDISKLSAELNSMKKANQNITSASNELLKTVPDFVSSIRKKYNIVEQPESQVAVAHAYAQAPLEKCAIKSLANKEHAGDDDESSGAAACVIANAPLNIENNLVDHCDFSDISDDDVTETSKSPPEPPNETLNCPDNIDRQEPEVAKERGPVDNSCGNNGNPRIILKLSKKTKTDRKS